MSLFEIYNNKMTSYQFIQLFQWERYAQDACLATDFKVKDVAEQFFFNFIQAPKIDIILKLMNQGSDLLLFALFNYAIKYPHQLIKNTENVYLIMQVVRQWQLHELNFCRFGSRPFANFVTNTIMQALGVFMKYLYENSQTSNTLVKYLQQMPLSYFKMYLFRNFISTVETIDNEMGFMRFRTMVYNFQDNIIPLICDNLIPFFEKFEEGVKISQLSQLQSKLDVNDNQSGQQTNREKISLSKEQDMQSQLVLMLLKKIVEFNYNITYSQYESEQAIDTCLITFPDKILTKIINHQFLQSLFYVVNKVCSTKIGQKKNQYLSIVLECLAKIMQSRLGFIPEKEKQLFIQTSVSGLNHLLKVCQQIQSQILLIGILNCNKKLFMSVEPSQIRKILNKDDQMRQNQLGKIYVRELSWMIQQIIRRSAVHVDNNLLNEALEVGCKLISGLNYKEFEVMEQRNEESINFAKEMVRSFVGSLCQPKHIFSNEKVIWISQYKQSINHLFEQFKKISSYCYKQLFENLKFYLDYKVDLVVLGNIVCLLSELVDNTYLSRNINLNQAKEDQIAILAAAIVKAETFCTQYIQNRQSMLGNKDSNYLDISILIFAEAIILQFLSNFEAIPHLKIKRKLYLVMSLGQGYSDYVQHEDTNSQLTILNYLNLIFPFLQYKVEEPDMEVKILYALQIIQKIIFKLKWHMKRQVFLKCQLFKKMLSFFESYFNKCYPSAQILVKVGKIIVTLNFDDILDEYKFRINKFIKNLPKDNMMKVFYYLLGIFEAIQPSNIFKYFYNRLKQTMDFSLFFTQIFKMAIETNSQKSYKDVCRFCKTLILNKGLKNSNCSTLVYQIFNIQLPHLVWFLKSINSVSKIDVDLFGDCIIELIQLFCGVINSTHVNIFLLDESSQKKEGQTHSLGVQFVLEYFKLIGMMTGQMNNYPKLQQQILNCFTSINKELLDFIFDNPDRQMSEYYNRLILAQIDISVVYIGKQLQGNKSVQDRLIKVIDSLKLFYQYINRRCQMIHKMDILQNLQGFYNISQNCQGENKNEKLVFYTVTLVLTNNKNNISYIRSFSKLIYELNKRFQNHLENTFIKLRLDQARLSQIKTILEEGRKDYAENFVEKFKSWVKDFNDFK